MFRDVLPPLLNGWEVELGMDYLDPGVEGPKIGPLAILPQEGLGPCVRTARFGVVFVPPGILVRRVVAFPPNELTRTGRIVRNRGGVKLGYAFLPAGSTGLQYVGSSTGKM